ncbi:MAG: hypothetical protein OXC30_00005, partial [Alphaproteobacteria bacterium]|nr:hypothetical protein [Alphaproteobacteria bacterium]
TRKKKLMARQDSKTLKKIEDLLPHKDENLDATHTSLEETKDPLAFSKPMSQVEPAEIDLDKIDLEQTALFSSPWIVKRQELRRDSHLYLEETKDLLAFSKSMSQVEPSEIDWEQAALFSPPWGSFKDCL